MSISGSGSLLSGIEHGSSPGGGGGGGGSGGGQGQRPKSAETRKAILAGIAAVVGIAAMCIFMFYNFFGSDTASVSARRVVIDNETGEVNEKFPVAAGAFPYVNPKTGRATLYPAESCFWTRDGKAKLQPTYVLLNEYCNPPKPGPTICPDCGHVVRAHNPHPPSNLFPQP
jgi:hypothetical protein